MATFSENQVRHLYVVNAAADFAAAKSGEALYFTMKDAEGKPVRSDLIENIISAKAVPASSMERKTRVIKVTMDADALVSGAPIAGEDYVVRLEYRQFVALSDEVFYHEFGTAHAKSSSTVASLMTELAKNLAQNVKRQEMVSVALLGTYATTGETEVALSGVPTFSATVAYAIGDVVLYNGDLYRFKATHSAGAWSTSDVDAVTIAGILIKEIEQPWILGVKQETPVLFEVSTSKVTVNGDEMAWGVATEASATYGATIGNGKTIADMEYFYHGERGDIYRNISWPQVIPTKYMVDASKTYDVIDIHYAFVGANHEVQKSEKTITVVCPIVSNAHTVANAVIAAINTQKAGLLSTL